MAGIRRGVEAIRGVGGAVAGRVVNVVRNVLGLNRETEEQRQARRARGVEAIRDEIQRRVARRRIGRAFLGVRTTQTAFGGYNQAFNVRDGQVHMTADSFWASYRPRIQGVIRWFGFPCRIILSVQYRLRHSETDDVRLNPTNLGIGRLLNEGDVQQQMEVYRERLVRHIASITEEGEGGGDVRGERPRGSRGGHWVCGDHEHNYDPPHQRLDPLLRLSGSR